MTRDEPGTTEDTALPGLAVSSSVNAVGQLVSRALTFALLLYFVRILPPGEYGSLTLALSIVTVVVQFVGLGLVRSLDHFVPFYLARAQPERARAALWATTRAILLSAVIATIVLAATHRLLGVAFDDVQTGVAILVLSLAVPFWTLFTRDVHTLLGLRAMGPYVLLAGLALPATQYGLASALYLGGAGWLGAVAGFALAYPLMALASWIVLRRIAPALHRGPRAAPEWRALIRYSWPLAVSNVVQLGFDLVPVVVLGYFGSPEEVAYYRVGIALAGQLLLVSISIGNSLKSIASEAIGRGDEAQAKASYRSATRWSLLLGTPVAVLLCVFPSEVLSLLFGPQYAGASGALLALIAGYYVVIAIGPVTMMLEGYGLTRHVLVSQGIGLAVSAVVAFAAIPAWGAVGAAMAASSWYIASHLAAVAALRSTHGYTPASRPHTMVLVAGATALAAGLLVRGTTTGWVGIASAGVASIVTYLAVAFLLRAVSSDDLRQARDLLRLRAPST